MAAAAAAAAPRIAMHALRLRPQSLAPVTAAAAAAAEDHHDVPIRLLRLERGSLAVPRVLVSERERETGCCRRFARRCSSHTHTRSLSCFFTSRAFAVGSFPRRESLAHTSTRTLALESPSFSRRRLLFSSVAAAAAVVVAVAAASLSLSVNVRLLCLFLSLTHSLAQRTE